MSLSPDYRLAEVSQPLFHRDKYLCRATIAHKGTATHRDQSNWGNRDISVSAPVGGDVDGGVGEQAVPDREESVEETGPVGVADDAPVAQTVDQTEE